MKTIEIIQQKIMDLTTLAHQVNKWRLLNTKIVFTNGVFDVFHDGHLASLCEAASHGNMLVVAVNSDNSVKKLKGPTRPVFDETVRANILAALIITDAIIIFDEETPIEIIKTLLPDVLVKGGDYTVDQVAGAKEVIAAGGEVVIAAMLPEISTTTIISRLKNT